MLPLVKISGIPDNFWGSKGLNPPPPPQEGHFMDAESVRKILKIYNFTTTNAILMKLTKVMYLHKTFHFIKDWAVTHRA